MIYFIQSGEHDGPIKIGFTAYDDALARMNNLQIGNPHRLHLIATMGGTEAFELSIHERFAIDRIRGEWFRASERLIDYIRDHRVNLSPTPSKLIRPRSLPSMAHLMHVFRYDVETGTLFWRERPRSDFDLASTFAGWNSKFAGQPVGTQGTGGRRYVRIDRKPYRYDKVIEAMEQDRGLPLSA